MNLAGASGLVALKGPSPGCGVSITKPCDDNILYHGVLGESLFSIWSARGNVPSPALQARFGAFLCTLRIFCTKFHV